MTVMSSVRSIPDKAPLLFSERRTPVNHVAQTVIPVAGGLDVHKSFVVAAIKSTSDQGTVNTVKKKVLDLSCRSGRPAGLAPAE